MSLKIGVMVPRSDMYPALGMDFLNGLKLSFSQSMLPEPQFIIEGIGNATDKSLMKTAEKLVLQENVDITISFCSVFFLDEFVALFNSYRKLLIHVDLGGSVLKKEHVSPYVFHLSLNLCQSAYTSGEWAAKNLGKKVFMASSFYDGGYQMTESFVQGFTKHGGEVVGYYVGISDYKSDDPHRLIEGLQAEEFDFLFALFSFNEGKRIFDTLANSEFNGKLPILVVPTMTDPTIVTENLNVENVHSIASWAFDDESEKMKNFKSSYTQAFENQPNIISLLGYEAGLTVEKCVNSEAGTLANFDDLKSEFTIDSPRGKLSCNHFIESHPSSFKLRKFEFNETQYHNHIKEEIIVEKHEDLYKNFEEITYTGWMNPYICT
ncbi:MAG: ABC transporter substrate-binding protein [Flavobacteriaceae bacterium]|nr:ABC transporter substrate-binding protein [Flavobacteriaceae bacterium]